jgi:mono/diheme cytochrome c family protein
MRPFFLPFALAAVAAVSAAPESLAATPTPVPDEVLEWVAPTVERARPNPISHSPEAVKKGRGLFIEHCAVCHGTEGRGDGPAARPHARKAAPPRDLTRSEVQARLTDGEIHWKIVSGLRWQGRIIMPAFGEEIPNEENRWRLILFVRTLAAPTALDAVGGTLYAAEPAHGEGTRIKWGQSPSSPGNATATEGHDSVP